MPNDYTSVDRCYSAIELPLTIEQFHRLPENPDYKYEYLGRKAWLSPRPNSYHALLTAREPEFHEEDAAEDPRCVERGRSEGRTLIAARRCGILAALQQRRICRQLARVQLGKAWGSGL